MLFLLITIPSCILTAVQADLGEIPSRSVHTSVSSSVSLSSAVWPSRPPQYLSCSTESLLCQGFLKDLIFSCHAVPRVKELPACRTTYVLLAG